MKDLAVSEPYPVSKKNTEKQSPTVLEDESVTDTNAWRWHKSLW